LQLLLQSNCNCWGIQSIKILQMWLTLWIDVFFCFLKNKTYNEHNLFQISQRTFKTKINKTWNYLFYNLKEIKIENYKDNNSHKFLNQIKCIIDTIPFKIPRGVNFQAGKEWYCPHKGMYFIKYQLIICRRTGLICSIVGPYKGAKPESRYILENFNVIEKISKKCLFYGRSSILWT